MRDMNLMQLMEEFDTDEECRAMLVALRWPNGVACLRCGAEADRYTQSRKQFDCGSCGYQFSVTAGTIFHDSKLPLPKWFAAIYLVCESKKGISSNQLKRNLGVTYKTAWYLTHRIRHAMGLVVSEQLQGIIEADETFHGGKPRYARAEVDEQGRHKRGIRDDKRKAIVLGALERGGDVRFRVAGNRNYKTIKMFLDDEVMDNAEAIYTDDWGAYRLIGDADMRHESVNHSKKEYVRGDVHTNGIESVWSLFKRSVIGSYHQLSEKHLNAYLDELEWRFNNRDSKTMFRDTLIALLSAGALEYKVLTADAP